MLRFTSPLFMAGAVFAFILASGNKPLAAQPSGTSGQSFHGYEDLRWRSVRRPKIGPVEELLDYRSPVVAHETKVELDKEFELFGHKLTFELSRGRLKIRHTEPDSDREKTKTVGRLPALLELEREDEEPYAIAIRLSADSETVFISSAYAMLVKVGRDVTYIVDSDRDGTIGSAGDGLIVPGSRTVAVWRGQIWTAGAAVGLRLEKDSDDEVKWEMADLPMPTRDSDHSAAWRILNWRRQQVGMTALRYEEDDDTITAMKNHADYCGRYGREAREQPDPDEPGYTETGAKIAPECIVAQGVPTHVKGIEEFLKQMFQRSEMLSGALTKTTMVLHNQVLLINTRRHTNGELRPMPLIWPPHGMEDVERGFRREGETPMPVLEPARGNARGTVVGAWLFTLAKADAIGDGAELVLEQEDERGRGQKVAGDFFYPGNKPETDEIPKSYHGNIAFIPERTFPGGTTFHARVRFEMPAGAMIGGAQAGSTFEYEWSFKTK